jgi:hypothetical protein
MSLQSEEGSERQLEVPFLSISFPNLCLLDATALFDPSVIRLNAPALYLQLLTLLFGHLQVVRRPVLRVAVWSDRPKHTDEAYPLR